MSVQDILKNRRTELGLTMKELAARVGVNEGTISRWESGDIANMRRDKIVALANALNISPSVIMEWDDTRKQDPAYFFDPETAQIAQEIKENKFLGGLFETARDATPEDLLTAQTMLEALKRKERGET